MFRRLMTPFFVVAASGVIHPISAQAPPAWVEYEVSGAWSVSSREYDVVICSDTGEHFLARSLGNVIIDLEADGRGEGEHEMSTYVSNPEGGRSEGRGTLTIRATGEEAFGMPIYEVEFEASDLRSRDGVVLDVRGTMACVVM